MCHDKKAYFNIKQVRKCMRSVTSSDIVTVIASRFSICVCLHLSDVLFVPSECLLTFEIYARDVGDVWGQWPLYGDGV